MGEQTRAEAVSEELLADWEKRGGASMQLAVRWIRMLSHERQELLAAAEDVATEFELLEVERGRMWGLGIKIKSLRAAIARATGAPRGPQGAA